MDLITKVYFNEHLTHSCVGMPQGLQALLSSFILYQPVRHWGLSDVHAYGVPSVLGLGVTCL